MNIQEISKLKNKYSVPLQWRNEKPKVFVAHIGPKQAGITFTIKPQKENSLGNGNWVLTVTTQNDTQKQLWGITDDNITTIRYYSIDKAQQNAEKIALNLLANFTAATYAPLS